MSLMDSKGMLSTATKDLLARWNDVKTVWNDAQSKAFENNTMHLIEQDVRSTLGAMDTMSQILTMIENDCE